MREKRLLVSLMTTALLLVLGGRAQAGIATGGPHLQLEKGETKTQPFGKMTPDSQPPPNTVKSATKQGTNFVKVEWKFKGKDTVYWAYCNGGTFAEPVINEARNAVTFTCQ